MNEKFKVIATIFGSQDVEEAESELEESAPFHAPLEHGKYYGGVYNGRKYMYSEKLIETLSPERLERFIKNQIGFPKED